VLYGVLELTWPTGIRLATGDSRAKAAPAIASVLSAVPPERAQINPRVGSLQPPYLGGARSPARRRGKPLQRSPSVAAQNARRTVTSGEVGHCVQNAWSGHINPLACPGARCDRGDLVWPVQRVLLRSSLTWRCKCRAVTYGPALAEGCSLLNGPARGRQAEQDGTRVELRGHRR
jgi:hypothetical protein